MSTTSTSTVTEKVDGRGLADVGEETGDSTDKEHGEEQVNTTEIVGEYPTGFRLAMVILALVLAVFLVALDLVC